MSQDIFTTIFKNGSRTYYYSSLFFPEPVKEDVFILYSFVRTADDYVDSIPQQKKEYQHFKNQYFKALQKKPSNNPVIDRFVELAKRKKIPASFVRAFFASMDQDLRNKKYKTLSDTLQYMYGSAEVIGLMMGRILELPKRSYKGAQLLGRAMQYANFIRDIEEDITLGRCYIPQQLLSKHSLMSLSRETEKNTEALQRCIREQIDLYNQWMKEARQAFVYIPTRYRIPIETASKMYSWTLQQIQKDPLIVYRKKIKPSVLRIIYTVITTTFRVHTEVLLKRWNR